MAETFTLSGLATLLPLRPESRSDRGFRSYLSVSPNPIWSCPQFGSAIVGRSRLEVTPARFESFAT